MKIKSSAIAVAVVAVVLAVVLALPMMTVPATASETVTYLNQTFEDVALGKWTTNPGATAPSKATVIDEGDNRVLKLETVPADASNTTGVADANVDKNIVLSNSAFSYETVQNVVLEVKYYISSDAEGYFQSQFLKFSSTASGAGSTYLDLYRINLTTGTIYGKNSDGSGILNKGAWNTVSMVLNLKDATYSLYANGEFVVSNTLNKSVTPVNLSVAANQWIIAKLNKGCASYAGYILIDDAKITSGTYVERTYSANDFENYEVGKVLTSAENQGNTWPSLAKIDDFEGNRVIKLETVPGSTTEEDIANEIANGGKNVDRNILMPTTKVSYSDADRVYLRTEYYISEGAKGSVESQFMSYQFTDDEGVTHSASWFALYQLNLDGGYVSSRGSYSPSGILKTNAWNTVTVVLDLDSGEMQIYVNEAPVIHIDAGYTVTLQGTEYVVKNLTLPANRWIIAKLNKYSPAYNGYIYIDNARMASYSEEVNIYTPDMTDENGNTLWYLNITDLRGKTRKAMEGNSRVFSANGLTIEPVYFDASKYEGIVAPVKGASIRLTNAAGIRFATQLDTDILSELLALKEAGEIADVSIGTLISPKAYVDTAKVFTMEGLDSSLTSSGAKYLNVKGTVGHYYGKLSGAALEDGYDAYFVGSIANVKLGNRDKDFSAVGYVQVRFANGNSVYLYSYTYDENTIANYSRNVKGVAISALSDYNNGNVTFTERELMLLNGFQDGTKDLALSSSAVLQNVQYTNNEFFFRNAAGVYCRLTYEGANGWRLQANGTSYNGFDETGAGQALAIYLGETVSDKTEPLIITTDASKVKIKTANSGTYVTLNYTGSFNMQFYTAKGTAVSNVNAISVSNVATATSTGSVVISGTLASGEAVYGGGERFDVVNQRGNAFSLYTRDGWNRGDTSYMAIPLFVTSRGAGMFINRYENMSVDFGATSSSVWSVDIKNEMIDCYFYATGKISDALFGYTEISGHSSLPEEWAQGELICRYSPDLAGFEDNEEYVTGYASHKDLPAKFYDTRGVKAVKFSSYKSIPNYTNYYVQASSGSSYTKLASNTSSSTYNLNTLYTDDAGSAVAYAKVGSYYYALGKTWATLAEADAFGVTAAYDWNYLFQTTTSGTTVTGITSSYKKCFYIADDGMYYQAGSKGNPAGHGVKTIVTNLINAGMKPTAMVMEPFGWGNISSNSARYEELKKTVEWLDDLDIKSMFYMGVGSISNSMKGYKPEYQVWATITDTATGAVTDTYKIPKTSGTGENPDVGDSSTQQYIDVTNPDAVDWYMNEIWGMMIDLGVDGIKIDFCECMPDEGSYSTYDVKYNFYDDTVFDGDDIHHGYSTYFISLFYKSMLEQKAAKNIPDGFVVLSRGGGIGSQRNPYLWEGDQTRSFDKIEDQLIALINSGISGVPFMTYDLAGYAYASSGAQIRDLITLEQESEIFARAIEYTAFTSNIQSHGDVRHAYQMTEETQEIYRDYTNLHEELIPYIQRYSQIACDTGMPVVRAMILEYQDDTEVYGLETQYMFGSSLLVAPVTTEGATSKSVYLPAGEWLDLNTGNTIVSSGQTVIASAALSKIPVYMKVGCDGEDQNLLADVFNGATWKKISGVQLNIEKVLLGGDPWGEDPFDEEDPFAK